MRGLIYERTTRNGKSIDTHRAIMQDYIGRKLGRNEYVHHINGNKQDNRIENLQVLSPLEHGRLHNLKHPLTKICKVCGKEFEPPMKHRARNSICSRECWSVWQNRTAVLKNKHIIQLDLNGEVIKEFGSIKEAALEVNGLSTNIVKCAKGKIKSAYGYKWEYDV